MGTLFVPRIFLGLVFGFRLDFDGQKVLGCKGVRVRVGMFPLILRFTS